MLAERTKILITVMLVHSKLVPNTLEIPIKEFRITAALK